MPRATTLRRSLALASAVLVTALGGAAVPALADPGNGPGDGTGQGDGSTEQEAKGDDKAGQADEGDPAGNNGTVKITPHGEMDGIPQNSPHPGCVFDIEWYGFDEGDDIVSTVEFAMQAPTSDVGLSGTEPSRVFVGGDPATGAGTDTGFDGEATYELVFDGAPHAQQGFHVKLTVHTPGAQGADTKHKVFWVEPCQEVAPAEEETGTEEETEEETEGETEEPGEGTAGHGADDDEEQAGQEVLGTQASAGSGSQAGAAQAQAAAAGEQTVPTAVDAGERGESVVESVTSPLWLLIGGGLAVAGAAVLARRATP